MRSYVFALGFLTSNFNLSYRRRGQRIVINSKQEDMKEETESAEKSTEKTSFETKNVVVKMKNTLLSLH